jgi:hypothetical protein
MQLISLDNLKLDLGVADNERDALLERLNDKASAEVEAVVGYPIERAVRTHKEHVSRASTQLLIPFLPLHAVTKITVAGEVWFDLNADPAIEPGNGFGFTQWGTVLAPYGCAFAGDVELELESGFRLENTLEHDRDVPLAFENAVGEIVKQRLHAIGRDPNIRTESVPGVFSVTFGNETASATGVSPLVWQMLAPYRIVRVN